MASSRQTLSYLREQFQQHGISPRHRYGQNFLIDLNLHELITRTAEITAEDVILEVGPGAGALTTRMAPHAAAIIAIEIDPLLANLTRAATADFPSVSVLNIDALAAKHELHPDLVQALSTRLATVPNSRLKLVANLPFNIATPLLSNLLVHETLRLNRAVITIQRELAERLLAQPTTEHYGALTVLTQALADVHLIRILAPSVFWPRPKVESAIMSLEPRPEKYAAIGDLPWFHAVVRRVFQHRRKNLRGVLHTLAGKHLAKESIDRFLSEQGLDGQLRAEALNVEEWITLAAAMKPHFPPDEILASRGGGPIQPNQSTTKK